MYIRTGLVVVRSHNLPNLIGKATCRKCGFSVSVYVFFDEDSDTFRRAKEDGRCYVAQLHRTASRSCERRLNVVWEKKR